MLTKRFFTYSTFACAQVVGFAQLELYYKHQASTVPAWFC